MWPSPVGHCVRDAGVARSNRAIPTIFLRTDSSNPSLIKYGAGLAFFQINTYTCRRQTIILTGDYGSYLEDRKVHANDHSSHNNS